MNPLVKALVAGLPIVVAGLVGMMYLMPAMEEMDQKNAQLEQKQGNKEELTGKLRDEKKVLRQKNELEQTIQTLRSAVPKQPDMELFTVDLEKMCKESGVDLISIQPPKKEDGSSEPEKSTLAKRDKLKNALSSPGAAAANAVAGAAGAANAVVDEKPDLEEVTRQIEVTGDYNSIMRLVHKLECYQRVIKITQMKEWITKKDTGKKEVKLPDSSEPGENDLMGDPKQLYVSMKISAYYLP